MINPNIITKPFREGHADIFECAVLFESEFRSAMPLLIQLGKADQCGSHIIDGKILYVGGWIHVAPGVAELFIYPSVYAKLYPKTFLEHARWWVQNLKQSYRRLQCWGEDTDLSKRWLKRLGFSLEGTLAKYTESGSMTIWGLT